MDKKWQIISYKKVGSTMDIAASKVRQAKNPSNLSPFVIVAKEQTAGRGRFQRKWISASGNFHATYGLKYNTPFDKIGLYSLITSVAIVDTFKELKITVDLKWPNDIFLHGKKIGGILLEHMDEKFLLIGIGLNLKSSPQEPLIKPATSIIEATGKSLSLAIFTSLLGKNLALKINAFEEGKWLQIREEWQNYCFNLHQVITIKHLISGIEQETTGTCLGLHENGSLIIEDILTGKTCLFYTGDVM